MLNTADLPQRKREAQQQSPCHVLRIYMHTYICIYTYVDTSIASQLPFKTPQIPSNTDHKALNRVTLGGAGICMYVVCVYHSYVYMYAYPPTPTARKNAHFAHLSKTVIRQRLRKSKKIPKSKNLKVQNFLHLRNLAISFGFWDSWIFRFLVFWILIFLNFGILNFGV